MSRAADGRSSIHKRSDGTGWDGWVSFGTDPASGRRARKHVRGRTRAEVSDKIRELESARDAGKLMTGPDTTLSAYLDTWMAARTSVVRPSTLAGYRTDLRHVARSGVGAVKLRALAPEHIERLYAAVLASGISCAIPSGSPTCLGTTAAKNSSHTTPARSARCSPSYAIDATVSVGRWPSWACGRGRRSGCAGPTSIHRRLQPRRHPSTAPRQPPAGARQHPDRHRELAAPPAVVAWRRSHLASPMTGYSSA